MAFNLRNFGTALGGLTGGWNQAQDAYLRQAISRQAMQQQQRQQQAETLAALALMGGNIPGLGGFSGAGGGMQNLPTPPMPGAASTPAAPPMGGGAATPPQPPMPQQAPAPPPMMGAGTYYGSNTYAPTNPATGGAVPGRYSDRQLDTGEAVQVEELAPPATQLPAPAPGDTDIDNTRNLRMPGGVPDTLSDAGTAPGVPPPGGYGAGETVSAPGKPGEPLANVGERRIAPSSEQPAEQHVIAQTPSGQMLSIGNLFQAVNPQTIAQRVAASAPPGTDPAAIFEATQKLVQMANGNKQEQIMAAQLGKLLGLEYSWGQRKDIASQQIQSRENIAGQQIGSREKIAGENIVSRQTIAAQNRDAVDKRMRDKDNKIDARLAQREAFQAEQNAIKRGDAASARQIQSIRASIAAINAQIPRGDRPNDAQQKQLDLLGQQLATILGNAEAVRTTTQSPGAIGTQLPVEVQNPQQ